MIQGFTDHVEGIVLETGNLTPLADDEVPNGGIPRGRPGGGTTLSSLRNKTDWNDARGIAQILRTG